ncbi:DUF1467 family protein [Roseobacter sp. HKCCD9010]|uniref:DUF1467 family protein n=1 Tax=unclassified Roseobacter TaxID=196798 RepID=UPI001492BED2|nr:MULTISPECIES: DUF1467 family protein [unclassified Roseobacter]MBF9051365.1 DUF1467 family protein [Rhodobacterales bacterium HKCCD4356]NNV13412.1 DUF1467 family protein [Roseobacter sp. HKCCD7357]NNV17663.1 DUF1467 family protein [Roseobacter sp. HKCCD8768]NNV27269.1 DUF1467 family protein [Roseobacter sp. HKCCD8192]NNV31389.1 DUF1467 family protein [Roseobacter sp. HKCCD9061]
MNLVTGIVLYAIIWFMTLFVILPIRLISQGEAGNVAEGTHASAPEKPQLKRRFLVTSAVAAVLWGIAAWVIISGAITIADIDLFNRFGMGQR